jgi:hypothetical protein
LCTWRIKSNIYLIAQIEEETDRFIEKYCFLSRFGAAVFAQLLLVTREHHEEVLLQALRVSG